LVASYGFLLFYFKPYKLEKYNRIDLIQTFVLGFSIYLGFISYHNNSQTELFLSSLVLIGIINVVFIIWSVRLLTHAFLFSVKEEIETLKIMLLKVSFFRKFCFSKKERLHYLRRRWIKSVLKAFKHNRVINTWTGKLKADSA